MFWSESRSHSNHSAVTDNERRKKQIGSKLGDKFNIIHQMAIDKSQNQRYKYESLYGNQIFKYKWDIDRLFSRLKRDIL